MHGVRLNIRVVFDQSVQDVDRLVDPAGNEAAEQGDIHV